jgi:hypothetical protein
MSKDISDVNGFYTEFYNSQQSVIVAFNIERIALVPNTVNTIERFFDVCETVPLCVFCFVEPIFQCSFGTGVFAAE